jgi:2,4-didehydro-3-deoxy-L-rhamnonate hydrolase
MKLVRFGDPGEERPGVWLENTPKLGATSILDVRAMAFDIEDYDEHFFKTGGISRVRALLRESGLKLISDADRRLGPPVPRPGKIICMAGNYTEHVKEAGAKMPSEPVFFNKASSAVIGPFDDIILPSGSKFIDAEAELAVVIGKQAKNVAREDATDYVAGYMALNDVSDREAQRSRSQWFWGKSPDTFCPMGPWLATADEISCPDNLGVAQILNGKIMQDGNTRDMIFDLPFIIAYLSSRITLFPGDVISTGTPAGVGFARNPPVTIRHGDLVEIVMEGLGRQKNRACTMA